MNDEINKIVEENFGVVQDGKSFEQARVELLMQEENSEIDSIDEEIQKLKNKI